MGSSGYTFYDYIDADRDGTNLIRCWLNGDGKGAKGFFMVMIPLLEDSSPPGWEGSRWVSPRTKPMSGEWKGFTELRKLGKVNYRLIGQMRGHDVFLVAYAVHKGNNFDTNISPRTALDRVNQMINNPTRYRRKHEYG